MSSLLQWISATVVVLGLVILMGRLASWTLKRGTPGRSEASQLACWRIAPDARVRAIRVFDEVHLLYERGRESTLLQSLSHAEFSALQPEIRAQGGPGRLLRFRPGKDLHAAGGR